MTRSASSCSSFYQLQDVRAIAIILMLLLSVVSVDAGYKGVRTRNSGKSFRCERYFVGVFPREKIWVGTYPTEEQAALAHDVMSFYTNRPSNEFHLAYSEDLILQNCKPRSAYDSLNGWEERKAFIRNEANALINSMFAEDQAPDFRREDVAVPPIVQARQRSGDVAWTIVRHFRNQAERLREFMAWLMRLSNAAAQPTLMGHVQTFLQQQSGETISQLDIDEALPVGGDQFFDAARVMLLLDSIEAWSGGALWLALIASSSHLLFEMFSKKNARDIKDASINAIDASYTEQESCYSRAKLATKRQKANQPSSSTELVPDQEDKFTAIHLEVNNGTWQCTGYDMRSKKWMTLPLFLFPAAPAPAPVPDSVCGHDSLMCANFSAMGAELVVFNPLTGKTRLLPPLLFPRHPVLLHIIVDPATNSYKVIVAGSSSPGEDHLSKKMEVLDSRTSKWEEMCDIPGPAFGLNEYQAGVCANGILYFISFLEGDGGKGVVAFDVENRNWLPNLTCPIPYSSSWDMLQLVENNGELYLFYEQVGKPNNTLCIDMLEISNSASEEVSCHWRNAVSVECGRGIQVYPEYMCVGFGEGKLCIFDNLGTGGVVYDMRSGRLSEILKQRPRDPDLHLITKIPASFNLQLSSDSDPSPSSFDDIQTGYL